MTPEVSRAVAQIRQVLNLEPGPELDGLIEAAAGAKAVDDLPQWARNVLAVGTPRP